MKESIKLGWLFLDIDGVLYPTTTKNNTPYTESISKSLTGDLDFLFKLNLTNLHRVNGLIKRFKIKNICIIDSNDIDLKKLEILLATKGFPNISSKIRSYIKRDIITKPSALSRKIKSFCKKNDIKTGDWISVSPRLVNVPYNVIETYNYSKGFMSLRSVEPSREFKLFMEGLL